MSISFDQKEQVRQATDIVELMSSYMELRNAGRFFRALCPWHQDHNPSLQINPERQTYKCWVCQEGGDAFSFLMKMDGLTFPEALQVLADRAGITLAQESNSHLSNQQQLQPASEKSLQFEALLWAEQQFHQFLKTSPQAESARRYLQQRQITPQSIQQFKIGFAPDEWDWLQKRAPSKYDAKILERVGLVIQQQRTYERFRGRVLFPIHDLQGKTVGFGGRILPELSEKTQAKYINSPETPVFSKGRLLYALNHAKAAIREKKMVLVMEGYTDVIAAHQFGVNNAVAVLGTALAEPHLQLLKRFTDRIVLTLDGDTAGRNRTKELLKMFVAHQIDMRILNLPEGYDPCDYLQEHGREKFDQLLENAPDALEHQFQLAQSSVANSPDTHQVNLEIEELLQTLSQAPRLGSGTHSAMRIKEEQMLNRLSREFHISEEILRSRLSELRGQTQNNRRFRATVDSPVVVASTEQYAGSQWEKETLELVLSHPDSLFDLREHVEKVEWRNLRFQRLFLKICELVDEGHIPTFERVILEYDHPEAKRILVDLQETSAEKANIDYSARVRGLLDHFARQKTQHLRNSVQRTLDQKSEGEDEERALLQQLLEQRRTEHNRPSNP